VEPLATHSNVAGTGGGGGTVVAINSKEILLISTNDHCTS